MMDGCSAVSRYPACVELVVHDVRQRLELTCDVGVEEDMNAAGDAVLHVVVATPKQALCEGLVMDADSRPTVAPPTRLVFPIALVNESGLSAGMRRQLVDIHSCCERRVRAWSQRPDAALLSATLKAFIAFVDLGGTVCYYECHNVAAAA